MTAVDLQYVCVTLHHSEAHELAHHSSLRRERKGKEIYYITINETHTQTVGLEPVYKSGHSAILQFYFMNCVNFAEFADLQIWRFTDLEIADLEIWRFTDLQIRRLQSCRFADYRIADCRLFCFLCAWFVLHVSS